VTHSDAVERHLAEKYLLFEMEGPEREEFELHFFSCVACTADLRDTLQFLDSAKSLLASASVMSPEAATRRRWWSLWKPAQARLSFALVITPFLLISSAALYQYVENRSLRGTLASYDRPRPVPEFTLLASRRGPVQSLVVPEAAREVQLVVDVNSDETFAAYRCDIRREGHETGESVRFEANQSGRPLRLLLPVKRFGEELTIRVVGIRQSGSESELVTHRVLFVVKGSK
jgi:hypothetical protein